MAIVRPGVHARLSIDPSSQFPSSINTAVPPPFIHQPPPFISNVPPPMIPNVPPPVITNVYKPSLNINHQPQTFPIILNTQTTPTLEKKLEEKKEIIKPELFLNKNQSFQNFFDRNKDKNFIGKIFFFLFFLQQNNKLMKKCVNHLAC